MKLKNGVLKTSISAALLRQWLEPAIDQHLRALKLVGLRDDIKSITFGTTKFDPWDHDEIVDIEVRLKKAVDVIPQGRAVLLRSNG